MPCVHLSKHMHHRANLFGICIPFAQRLECKVRFIFDPVGGVINQFVDMRIKDFLEIEVACSYCQELKRPPTKSLFLGCTLNRTRIAGSQSRRRSPSKLAGPGEKIILIQRLKNVSICVIDAISWVSIFCIFDLEDCFNCKFAKVSFS